MTTMRRRRIIALLSVSAAALLASCSGCGGNGGHGDTDTGTDTGLDTDTSWDGGPLTDCEGAAPGPGMVCVPGGRYLMGCMPYDLQCKSNEEPMVEVTLSPFWIDEKETTLAEIIPYLNWLLSQDEYAWDGYIYRVSDHMPMWVAGQNGGFSPVVGVAENEVGYYAGDEVCSSRPIDAATGGLSWEAAKLYCTYRGKRLPTEAEWEAAARGQTKWIYPCAWEHKACWYGKYDCCGNAYDAECPSSACEDPCCIPFKDEITNCPSPFGVKEMYGNAAEWVLDHDDADHSWCVEGCTDPAPRKDGGPILKGGGVGTEARRTRISNRMGTLGNPGPYSGVRCVSSPIDFILPDGGVVWGE
ncbi:MAG: formylglycine-generating enzyme family protein [Proteobacteria bacterium]|jgi:iron(II)-dependent oxidoreductase|nr:formylglycine-generating enzyme family protein [Pseudomonadota bacterium]